MYDKNWCYLVHFTQHSSSFYYAITKPILVQIQVTKEQVSEEACNLC
jgi:hypothetical protein